MLDFLRRVEPTDTLQAGIQMRNDNTRSMNWRYHQLFLSLGCQNGASFSYGRSFPFSDQEQSFGTARLTRLLAFSLSDIRYWWVAQHNEHSRNTGSDNDDRRETLHSSMQHSLSLRRNQSTSFAVKVNSRFVEQDGAPGGHLPSDRW